MSDLEALKTENENLKKQMAANSQGIHGLIAQVEAYQGELADSRHISLQLRTNVSLLKKSNNELVEANKTLQANLDVANVKLKAYEDAKSAEVPPAPLKEVAKGK